MPTSKPKTRYPYRLWANGDWHIALQGIDYQVKTSNFRIALNSWARNNGYTVEYWAAVDETSEQFRFIKGRPLCKHCREPFDRRTSNNKYCTTCIPDGDMRARQLMSYYRLSRPQYEAMRAALTDGLCPICHVWEATAVDHDHTCCDMANRSGGTCGTCVRGLLCVGCNIMIEKVESGQITAPEAAQTYLRLPRART